MQISTSFSEECKYKLKKTQISTFINTELISDSDSNGNFNSDSDSDYDDDSDSDCDSAFDSHSDDK